MTRQAVTRWVVLSVAIAAAAGLEVYESYSPVPYRDSVGVPTIGIGTTVYPDGARVTMRDPAISKERALELASTHMRKDAEVFAGTLIGAQMSTNEIFAGLDFSYQYGVTAWKNSSMLKYFKAGEYIKACSSFLLYKFAGGRDCSDPIKGGWGKPSGCKGVWLRQLKRYELCSGKLSIEQFQEG